MNFEIMEFPSKSAVEKFLRVSGHRVLLLTKDAESPRRYFAGVARAAEESEVIITFTSSIPGVELRIIHNGLWKYAVGVDDTVHVVDVESAITSRVRLPGVFLDFVKIESVGAVAINELGATKFNFSGKEVWSVVLDDTIANYFDKTHGILVEKGSGGRILINYESGRVEAA